MGLPDPGDPYLDPHTGILSNKVNARTQAELSHAETDLAFARTLELLDTPPRPTGDLAELQAIHRHLFQDIYDWAGQTRTTDLRKNLPGAEHFLPWRHIHRAAHNAAQQLRADNKLTGLPRDLFIERLAVHYDHFNYIHPFREGNGRTQRIFWNRIARDAGWQLDWQPIHGHTNDTASRRAAENQDLQPLCDMFDQITSPAQPRAQRGPDWQADELARIIPSPPQPP